MMLVRALIVDDVPINLKLLGTLLRGNGFHVESVATAEAALELLERETFAVMLVDVRLPGIDGLELTRRLRARADHSDLIIVAVTANAMQSDRDAAFAAGCDAFVSKPINTRTLVPLITSLLARGRP